MLNFYRKLGYYWIYMQFVEFINIKEICYREINFDVLIFVFELKKLLYFLYILICMY